MGNKSSPFVLRALCILGPEEILKLAHGLNREEVTFKKASGDDLVFWKERPSANKKKETSSKAEAKVLHFSRPAPQLEGGVETKKDEGSEEGQIMSSEVILLQREITRDTQNGALKSSARSGYQKSSEMYVVKSSTIDGKEKIRFASTNGVLINKKQA